jgi:hypothetical protein
VNEQTWARQWLAGVESKLRQPQPRKRVGEGRTGRRLAVLVRELLENARRPYRFDVADIRVMGAEGANRHLTYDGDRWEALAVGRAGEEHEGLTFRVRCMDTMSQCVRNGFTKSERDDSFTMFWVDANDSRKAEGT